MKDRVDYTVITLEGKGSEDGVDVRRVLPDKFSASSLNRYVSVLPSAFSALSRVRKDGKYIMHVHSNGIYGYSASLYSSLKGIPLLKEVQDTSDPGWVLRAGNVHGWVATGKYVERRLKRLSIPGDRIMTFPSINPPSTEEIARDLRENLSRPKDVTRFVFVGWLMNRIKGVDVLIDAFAEASSRENMELVVIGDGPDRGMLEEKASSLPVKFTGELPYEETLREIASSHALVLTSYEEANPRVILEAYAVSVPVIATDVGGTNEEVREGETGFLVPPGDADALSDVMIRISGDHKRLSKMGDNGKKFLEDLPSWRELSDAIYSKYMEMWRS